MNASRMPRSPCILSESRPRYTEHLVRRPARSLPTQTDDADIPQYHGRDVDSDKDRAGDRGMGRTGYGGWRLEQRGPQDGKEVST